MTMSETKLLPPLITDYSNGPASSALLGATYSGTGLSRSGTSYSSRGLMGFGTMTPGRFGHSSCYNAFFTRHTAKPKRVTHLKGLLGVPICTVNDEGYFANPRYSFQYQPRTSHARPLPTRQDLRSTMTKSSAGNKQWGLRNFQLSRNGPAHEFTPEVWRDELRSITNEVLNYGDNGQVGLPNGNRASNVNRITTPNTASADPVIKPTEKPARQTQYSSQTGRLIPTSSPLTSSHRKWTSGSRDQTRYDRYDQETDADDLMLQMLCQVLQTSDIGCVQAWLTSAPDRERSRVIEMIRQALDSSDMEALLTGRNANVPQQPYVDLAGQQLPAAAADSLHSHVDRLLIEDNDINDLDGRGGQRRKVGASDATEKRQIDDKRHLNFESDDEKDDFDQACRPVTAAAFRHLSKRGSNRNVDSSGKTTNRKSCLKASSKKTNALGLVRETTEAGRSDDNAMGFKNGKSPLMKRANTTLN